MNIRKSLLFSFLLVSFLSTSAFSNNNPEKGPENINNQIFDYLKGINIDYVDQETILIDFMINDNSEIIVVSTNSKALDKVLKKRLNYKKLVDEDLKIYSKYTLPISFRK